MKRTSLSVTRGAALAVALGALCVTGAAFAEQHTNPNGVPDTTSDNPHLQNTVTANSKAPAATLNPKDKEFISKAAAGGMMEVEMGKMAQKMGKSPDIKQLGTTMVTDHTKVNSDLKALAEKKGLTLGKPSQMPPSMGADFDRQYIAQMMHDHNEDIALFKNEAKNGTDADVKNFANRNLPTLQRHLGMVKALSGKTAASSKKKS